MQPNACAVRKVKDDMTGKGGDERTEPYRPQRDPAPNSLDVIYPALQVGGLSGMLVACCSSQTAVSFKIYT
jgi:hypothetical protein